MNKPTQQIDKSTRRIRFHDRNRKVNEGIAVDSSCVPKGAPKARLIRVVPQLAR
jgi:hypothetical protein